MTKNKPDSTWVLSRGSYSDYRVLCVVKGGKAEAESLAERANTAGDELYGDPFMAEELSVVSSDVQKVEILNLTAEIFDDGQVKDSGPHVRVEWPFDALYGSAPLQWRWVRAPFHNGKGGRLEVWGTDHERVRKVFSDRRASLMTDDALRSRRESRGAR